MNLIWSSSFNPPELVIFSRTGSARSFPAIVQSPIAVPSDASFLSGVLSSYAFTAHNVFSCCHWLKMLWVYAVASSALVVKLKSCWDRAYKLFVKEAVDQVARISNPNFSVPVPFNVPTPEPARISFFNFGQQLLKLFHDRLIMGFCQGCQAG